MEEYGENFSDNYHIEIDSNFISSLKNVEIHDNGDYLCIKDGKKLTETGFTSYNHDLLINHALGL